MDRDYIQLCAEMAYNEVILESYLESESLLEADNKVSFKERIKKFFEKIKLFIKNLFNKVIDFLKNVLINYLKNFPKMNLLIYIID